jgi:quinoprotein glucose dehydrogenase
MVHHDIWDYDTPMAPNLFDATINGQPRKVIAQTTKQGWIYTFDRVTGEPIWPIPETPVLQSDVPGEKASPTQPIPSRPAPYAQQGLVAEDLIDYTPAIRDSALKLAQACRMGPYFIPASVTDGSGSEGKKCSWYAPGASGGVNIDGGAAVDPETGMMFVGGQSGLGTIVLQKDPCSEFRFSSPRDNCGLLGAPDPPPGYVRQPVASGRSVAVNNIGGVSILKPKQLGGITAYDMTTGDRKWWLPNGGVMRPVTTDDPLFAGVTLPPVPAIGGQPQVINTKTLMIYGTGRSGGGRGGRRGGGAGAAPPVQPQLFAIDKATGRQVASVQVPQVNTAVPMTFLHKGKQYIVFAYGQGANTGLTALTLPPGSGAGGGSGR